jgi:hypothetical protein
VGLWDLHFAAAAAAKVISARLPQALMQRVYLLLPEPVAAVEILAL